jgi:hypothetical protein
VFGLVVMGLAAITTVAVSRGRQQISAAQG